VKVPFLKPVKGFTKIINFHATCTGTEEYNVDLGLYGKIWQLSVAVFCVRRMWRYYSSFVPRVVSPVRRLLTLQTKRAKTQRTCDDTQSVSVRAAAMLYFFSK